MKWLTKLLKPLTSRIFIVSVFLLIQIAFYLVLLIYLNNYIVAVQVILWIIAIILVIYIFNKPGSPSTKLPFVFLLALMPVFGVPFYLFCGNNDVHKHYRKSMEVSMAKTRELHIQDPEVSELLKKKNLKRYHESEYIYRMTNLPVHRNTKVTYFPSGESVYASLLEDLKKAQHFIFVEFFIIKPGEMWDTVRELLIDKAKQGVEVRFMYDDIGTAQYLPYRYDKTLMSKGIDCAVFNPFNPRLTVDHNYRDHRKIVVIDGVIGYTGGFNLADEYINKIEVFGHWKDSAIKLIGEAVWNETVIFLENWDFSKKIHSDFSLYTPYKYHPESFSKLNEGFVCPYSDNPLDRELVGESVYMNMIDHAEKYFWISTPYLIIDHELLTSLQLAAKSGVDVRIITPGISDDKKYAYLITRSYYPELVEAGVKIYEYTPGFIHAKNAISDDEVMTCGTINLDYRSLYHHFENGVWVYNSVAVKDMKADFEETLKVSRQITMEWCRELPLWQRLLQIILKITSPLL